MFTSNERKGAVVLAILSVIYIGLALKPQRTNGSKAYFLPKDNYSQQSDTTLQNAKKEYNRKAYYNKPIKQATAKLGKTSPIELNTCDSATLIKVRGIGAYTASKIISYRNKLGGYHSKDQLKELNLKYFNPDTLNLDFTVDTTYIIKKDLNAMSFKEILRHPYLEYEDVCLIFDAKKKYGNISIKVLINKQVLINSKIKRIVPYFK